MPDTVSPPPKKPRKRVPIILKRHEEGEHSWNELKADLGDPKIKEKLMAAILSMRTMMAEYLYPKRPQYRRYVLKHGDYITSNTIDLFKLEIVRTGDDIGVKIAGSEVLIFPDYCTTFRVPENVPAGVLRNATPTTIEFYAHTDKSILAAIPVNLDGHILCVTQHPPITRTASFTGP